MNSRVPPDRYPWWVNLARMGARSRTSQWIWFVVEVVFAACLVYFATQDTGTERTVDIFLALWAAAIAILSIGTIRWVDRNGAWPR